MLGHEAPAVRKPRRHDGGSKTLDRVLEVGPVASPTRNRVRVVPLPHVPLFPLVTKNQTKTAKVQDYVWRQLKQIIDAPLHNRHRSRNYLGRCAHKILDALARRHQKPPIWNRSSLQVPTFSTTDGLSFVHIIRISREISEPGPIPRGHKAVRS